MILFEYKSYQYTPNVSIHFANQFKNILFINHKDLSMLQHFTKVEKIIIGMQHTNFKDYPVMKSVKNIRINYINFSKIGVEYLLNEVNPSLEKFPNIEFIHFYQYAFAQNKPDFTGINWDNFNRIKIVFDTYF